MARFTQDQVNEAMAEFLVGEDAEWVVREIPAAGYNGPIKIYTKEVQNGSNEKPSE